MIEVRISPDVAPAGTYDPLDDIIAGAKLIPGYLRVSKGVYYWEWDVTFKFDEQVIQPEDAQLAITELVNKFSKNWGKKVTA